MKQNYVYLWYPLFHTQWNKCDKHNHQTTGIPGENHRTVASHLQTLSYNVASSTSRHNQDSNTQL